MGADVLCYYDSCSVQGAMTFLAGISAPSSGALVASACGGMLGGAAVVLAAILVFKSRKQKQYTLLEG